MNATIISVANNKGGIAKTTSTIHLGADLAQRGYKVLLIDFDPQRNLSAGYNVPEDYPYDVFKLLNGEDGFSLLEKKENLFILPGSELLDSLVYDINLLKDRLVQLEQFAEQANQKFFDFILIDCPPQPMIKKFLKIGNKSHYIPKLNEIAVVASDYALIPVHGEKYAINGLSRFIDQIISIRDEFNPNMDIAGVFFTKVLVNESNFRKNYEKLKEDIPARYFYETFVRKDIKIEQAKDSGKTIFDTDPKSRAAKDYTELTSEILESLKNED